MLNYETILSSYDDKLTLMQWLKKVEAALKDASAVSFKVNKKGDATLTFSIVFEDGSELESGEIVLQQGESVASAAIVNGHLILTLTNGDELDAGQLLNGDLNVSGNLAATGKITGAEIVEDMTGYSLEASYEPPAEVVRSYIGVCKNGNKLTFVISGMYTKTASTTAWANLAAIRIPMDIYNKIVNDTLGTERTAALERLKFYSAVNASPIEKNLNVKAVYNVIVFQLGQSALTDFENDTPYKFRAEVTFLLSENLAA